MTLVKDVHGLVSACNVTAFEEYVQINLEKGCMDSLRARDFMKF